MVRGFIWKLWSLLGVVIFGAAAFGMFAISLVSRACLNVRLLLDTIFSLLKSFRLSFLWLLYIRSMNVISAK